MDPLSTLASGIAVAGLAQNVIEKSAQALVRFHDAPNELQSLRNRVLLLHNLVNRIKARRLNSPAEAPSDLFLHDCLWGAEDVINDLLEESQNYVAPAPKLNKRTRIKWALRGHAAIEKCEYRIDRALQALNCIVLTVVLYVLCIRCSNNEIIDLLIGTVKTRSS